MKTCLLLLPVFALSAWAQSANEVPQPAPPVTQAGPLPSRPSTSPGPAETQRIYGHEAATLIAPDAAQKIVDAFHTAYSLPAAPRIVVYVNRELVSPAGMKLSAHTEKYERTESNVQSDVATPPTSNNSAATGPTAQGPVSRSTKTSGENTYQLKDPEPVTLADRQTVREVERLFGRAFRNAGAKLADQGVAASLIPDGPGHRLVGDLAAKDRAALAQVADIAIEVLISSRNLTVSEVSGDKTYAVPDIQVTAIRLKDSAIIGQASASDVLGKNGTAARMVQQFDMRDITEATALALMADMLTGTK